MSLEDKVRKFLALPEEKQTELAKITVKHLKERLARERKESS